MGTVSNVLNRPDHVSPAKRERVLAAITELRYVPNGSARQLRAGTISTVGALLLDISNPFFTEVARGVEDRLASDELTLMLASSDEDPRREARYLRLFEEHGVLGVLVTPASADIDHLLDLSRRGVAVVLLDRESPVPEIASVAVDDVAGAALAVRHLLAQGHRRIGFINGPTTLPQCANRRQGVYEALRQGGLDPAEALVEVEMATMGAEGGEAGAEQILATGDVPTALFCSSDVTALGALRTLRAHGLRIPEDMAVVGYDDVDFAGMLGTPLTSVRQPMRRLGQVATDLLLDGGARPAQHVVFHPELIVRESSTHR